MIGLGFGNFQAVTQEPFSFGNALQFDGVNDYVSLTSLTISGDLTLNFWVKTNNLLTTVKGVFSNSATNDFIWFDNTTLRFAVDGVPTNFAITSFIDTNWHMVSIVRNSTNATLYIDGSFVSTLACSVGDFTIDYIGILGVGFSINSTVDEVSVWNTALSSTDIANLYNEIDGVGQGDYATNYSPANLQAYWRMNGSGTDTTAVDEQGNYDGTLNNFPASGMWVAH
jgi:hypothetical protein